MVCSCVPFDLYCGDRFDKIVILFNSRICVCEFSVPVNCQQQIFVSTGVDFLFPNFFYRSLFEEFVYLHGCSCPCMCIYFQVESILIWTQAPTQKHVGKKMKNVKTNPLVDQFI